MMGGSLGAASLHWNAALPPHGRKLQTCPNTADEKWNWWNLELLDTNTKSLEVGETANKKIRYYRNTGKQTPVKTTKKSCCQRLPEGNRKKIMLHKMYLFVIRKSQCRVKLNWMRRKWTRQNRHLLANLHLERFGWCYIRQTSPYHILNTLAPGFSVGHSEWGFLGDNCQTNQVLHFCCSSKLDQMMQSAGIAKCNWTSALVLGRPVHACIRYHLLDHLGNWIVQRAK